MFDIWAGPARAKHFQEDCVKIDMLYLTSSLLFANAFAPYNKKVLVNFLFEMVERKHPERGTPLLAGYPLEQYPKEMTQDLQELLKKNPLQNFGLFGSIPAKIEKLTERLESYADCLFLDRKDQDENNCFRGKSLKKAMEIFLDMFPEYKEPDPELKPQAFVSNKAAERLLKVMVQILRISQAIIPPSKDDIYKELTDNTSNARYPKDGKLWEWSNEKNGWVLKKEVPYKELENLSKDIRYHSRSPEKELWERFKTYGLTGSVNLHTTHFFNLKTAEFNILNFVPIYERILNTSIELNDYSLLMGLFNPTTTYMSQQQMIGETLTAWPTIQVRQALLFEGRLNKFVRDADSAHQHQLFSQKYTNPYRIVETKDKTLLVGRVLGYFLNQVAKAKLSVGKPYDEDLLNPSLAILVKACPLSLIDIRSQQTFRAYDSIRRAIEILGFNPDERTNVSLKSSEAVTKIRDNVDVFFLPVALEKERKLKAQLASYYLQKVTVKNESERLKGLKAYFKSDEYEKLKDYYKNFEPSVFQTLESLKNSKEKLILLIKLEQDQTVRSKLLCELLYQDTGQTFIGSGLTFEGQRKDIWVQPFLNSIQHLALEGFYKIYDLKCFPTSVPKDVRKIWTALVEMFSEEEKKLHAPNVLKHFTIKKWDTCYSSILSLIPILHFEKNYGVSKRFSSWEHLAPIPSLFKTEEDIKISKGKLTSNLNGSVIFEKLLRQFQNFYGTAHDNIKKDERVHWTEALKKFFKTSFNLLKKKTYIQFLDWVLQNEVHFDLFKKLRIDLKKEFLSFFKKLNWDWMLLDEDFCLIIREEDESFEDEENQSSNFWTKVNNKIIEVDYDSWEEGKIIPIHRISSSFRI